jgi:hypothetical protein
MSLETMKRFLVSSLITFIASFGIAVLPMIDKLTLENLGWSTVIALLFTGVRGGLKSAIEFTVYSYSNYKKTNMACGGKKKGKKK